MGLKASALEGLGLIMTWTQNPDPSFWSGKRVLLTGHTGFKGAWMAYWLNLLGADVTALALPPATSPNLFVLARLEAMIRSHLGDLRDVSWVRDELQRAKPEIVFHLAAQALVRASYRDPVETFATNVMGTAHVLDAMRSCDSSRVAVIVTTDKVYRNDEHCFPYRESDPLGGWDPYSASKAATELVVSCYRKSYLTAQGVAVAAARAGNVIGGGDWSEDRLLPDAMHAWTKGAPLKVRRPNAVRPWQHVLEPLSAYLILAERLWSEPSLADAYNFGPKTDDVWSVRRAVEVAREEFGAGEVVWGDGSEGPHEAGLLALETSKSRSILGITPRWDTETAIRHTFRWHRNIACGMSARDACRIDLDDFLGLTGVDST